MYQGRRSCACVYTWIHGRHILLWLWRRSWKLNSFQKHLRILGQCSFPVESMKTGQFSVFPCFPGTPLGQLPTNLGKIKRFQGFKTKQTHDVISCISMVLSPNLDLKMLQLLRNTFFLDGRWHFENVTLITLIHPSCLLFVSSLVSTYQLPLLAKVENTHPHEWGGNVAWQHYIHHRYQIKKNAIYADFFCRPQT